MYIKFIVRNTVFRMMNSAVEVVRVTGKQTKGYSNDAKQTLILCQCYISPSIKMLTFVESVLHQEPFLHIAYSGRVDILQSQEQNHVPGNKMVENCNVSQIKNIITN